MIGNTILHVNWMLAASVLALLRAAQGDAGSASYYAIRMEEHYLIAFSGTGKEPAW